MERKPFHEVILDYMREEAEKVWVSAEAAHRLVDYGNIFRKAIIPKEKKVEIFKAIKDLAKKFPHSCGDTKGTERYLETLAEDIGE